jgi:UDP-N-acetylmuramate dehydrogenase
LKDIRDYGLKAHNTFGIEARCKRFLEFASVEEAVQVATMPHLDESPMLVIGGGSNLLLTSDFNGTVVHSAIMGVTPDANDPTLLRCGSGETWDKVVEQSLELGLYGMENLSLIPGEVGASAVQNIGAYGMEAAQLIDSIEAVEIGTGRLTTFKNEDCHYAYRYSRFKGEWKGRYLITHVTYRLDRVFVPRLDYGNLRAELSRQGITHPTPQQMRQAIIGVRRQKLPDPELLGNAGSFFMNPVVPAAQYEALRTAHPGLPCYPTPDGNVKIPAGWLIEQAGWKGKQLGPAAVHDRQALVLVNTGGAKGSDIVALCRAIQKDIREKYGIELQPEVNIL